MTDSVSNTRKRRYGEVHQEKTTGATYTPQNLATFVAKQVIGALELERQSKLRVLDPAIGDGALLKALLRELPPNLHKKFEIIGYDIDSVAVDVAKQALTREFPHIYFHIEQRDFLQEVLDNHKNEDLFSGGKNQEKFHVVIANPPYVRTQILGAEQAQKLARNFGLSGRIDLSYPFLVGISDVLVDGGIVGVITSNRFMTTKAGRAIRETLLQRFNILQIWDLGDTKLFDAAVLPAVTLAKRQSRLGDIPDHQILFSAIYETDETTERIVADPLAALFESADAVVGIPDGRRFHIRHGQLASSDPAEVWRISNQLTDQWLEKVRAHTWRTFGQIGKIRVGVKSTADKIFIRNDWNSLPGGRPELLRPLITRQQARKFRPLGSIETDRKEILYPHEVTESGRAAVELNQYPKSAAYLEQHRGQLESRKYLIDAGRRWYELWVPQDPNAWSFPKLVFPDISEKPVFWIDTEGGVVNGECYWLRCADEENSDLIWLALAIANSSFIETFYDHSFNNKLYAGRRRFITQYVEQFPLPDPMKVEVKRLIELTKQIYSTLQSGDADDSIAELDREVWSVFGLAFKEGFR